MAGVGPSGSEYVDEDQQYGKLLANLLNPPDEPQQQAQPSQPAQAAPDPRMAVPADQPPNPTLRTRAPQPQAAPTSVPASVTQNGAATGGAPPTTQKDWPAYYAQRAMQGGLDAVGKQQSAVDPILNQPTATDADAALIQKRAAYAQPLDPNAKEYRPGIGTRIVRGIDAVRRGGVLGAVDPGDVGATPYGAPTRQFGIDTNQRQQNAAAIDQQLKQEDDARKADTDRMGKIGTQEKDIAGAYSGIAKDASEQQTAENKDEVAQIRQQLADQGGLPKNDIQLFTAAQTEPDPVKRAQYQKAVDNYTKAEYKKFQYAAKATGDPYDDRRQALIDNATQQVRDLQDKFQYDPDTNTYSDPNSPTKTYTPDEYTDMKNQISTKLDKDLTSKKLRPLRVRFDPKDAGAGKSAQPAGAPTPPAVPKEQMKEGRGGTDSQGNHWTVRNGQLVMDKK